MTENCTQCPHYRMDRHLEYYNYPVCEKTHREIAFNAENGWDRMKWCPLEEADDKRTVGRHIAEKVEEEDER